MGPFLPLRGNQAAASDPDRHVWLSASAGTGKTQVLSARVFRLLLRGVDPGAILCLTFTKAGAAEMAERINGRLARWVRLPADQLRHDLFNLGEDPNDERLLHRARTLFARVLDAPGGGIRIQTIHGFCQGLLAAFPIEAGLVPGFRPLEAREEAQLAREALAALLVAERNQGGTRIADAIGAMSVRVGEGAAEAFLNACARQPQAMAALPADLRAFLRAGLDLPDGDIAAAVEDACAAISGDTLDRLLAANRAWGCKSGDKACETIAAFQAADPASRVGMLKALGSLFITEKGTAKAPAKLVATEPDYERLALAIGETCGSIRRMEAQAGYADCLAAALEAGRAYADAYVAAKRRTGAVDFDDLIRATLGLLGQPGIGDWVRFKLDQGTEHVLIDEAQDTNPAQWAIVGALVEEFFAGEGARAAGTRTLFAVGDYKQAIYGFQGTDPIFFAAAHRRFRERAAEQFDPDVPTRPLDTLSLVHSFRSTAPILRFVDAALGALPGAGMGANAALEDHASEVPGPGAVTLWAPTTASGDDDAEESWTDDATRRLAGEIARYIRDAIGTLTLRSGRTLQAGDVMVLVKRRGDLASLLVARLYAEGVPVAGVDRLRLTAPLAVQDLLAAIRFALQPDDDLSLANLLVSPLIGWTQDALMEAALREGGSLWRHLRATQAEARLAPLFEILRRADIATPYRLLEEMLSGPLDGRRKLLARLGEEARDPIDELLNAALTFESVSTPSLQRFLDWFDRGEVEIKRDPASGGNAVRVMTAHGAKGLQAPLVILADAAIDPESNRRDSFAWAPDGHDEPFPVFRPRKAERGTPIDDAAALLDARELEEHWRLFYVAATRAEEQLVIAGAPSPRCKGVPPTLSWYAAASAALDALDVPAAEPGASRRYSEGHAPVLRAAAGKPAPSPVPVPEWLRSPAPQEARPSRPLAPSSLGEDAVSDPPPGPAMRRAAERGRLLHQLFERLPRTGAAARAETAERWLTRAGGLDAADAAAIAADALRIVEDPAYADLFGSDALAEAPIAAVVGDGAVVSGTVDRLLVTDNLVRVVDFKTTRRPPETAADIPVYHLRQMAAYQAALEVVFPGRQVEAALLYTAGPELFTLDPAMLAAHKPRLVAPEQSFAAEP